jgi:hypothetical protein
MKYARLVLLLAFAGCQSALSNAGVPSASDGVWRSGGNDTHAAHLYVAVSTSTSRLSIERFRLHRGIPDTTPDRTYEGYGGLIAVSGDGTLYATSSRPFDVIYAFSPGSEKPTREIDVAPRCGPSSFTVINAIAADQSGYVFVLIYSYAGAESPRAPRGAGPLPDARTPCNGVAVYAPNANGYSRPVQAIRFPTAVQLNGLAVDANDNLYLSGNYPSKVEEFANAVVDPKRTRTFRGKYIAGVRSVATDSAGDLFIANAQQSYSSGWIDRYAPNAK